MQVEAPDMAQMRVRSMSYGNMDLSRFRVNAAHVRQSRTDSGLGFQASVFKFLEVVPSLQVEAPDMAVMVA